MFRTDQNYGRGCVTIDVDSAELPDIAQLLRTTFRSKGYKPPILPRAALELHRLSRESNIDLKRLMGVLETDPILAAAVLRRAQSAYYSRGVAVQSLYDALIKLGLVTVSNVFLEAAMTARVFRAPGYDGLMDRVRKHSVAVAHISARIARRTSLFEEYAFLCGLLHDVGAAGALIVMSDTKGNRNPPSQEVLDHTWLAILETHEELGGIFAEVWSLPKDVQIVLGNHHARTVNGMVHPLTATIAIAESIALELNFGMEEYASDDEWALKSLSLSGQRDSILAESKSVVAVLD